MDYKFLLMMRQESAGSDNAKVNVTINGVQVATDVEISQTSDNGTVTCHGEKFQPVVVEGTGLTAPGSGVTQNITITYTNDYYVDADTDRNVELCNIIHYTDKANGSDYKLVDTSGADVDDDTASVITDFTDVNNMRTPEAITSVSGYDDWATGSDITGYVLMSVNGDYTITFPTPYSSGRSGKYPGDSGYA